jgi:hypothetical protein
MGPDIALPPLPAVEERTLPLTDLVLDVEEQGQVTVHCHFTAGLADAIRIWPSTFLICRHTGHRSQLLLAEGIPLAPMWLAVPAGREIHFTLLFAGLPRECVLFDLVEEIPDPGGFRTLGILRNSMDVYRVDV